MPLWTRNAVSFALCLVAMFGLLVRVMSTHKAEAKEQAAEYATAILAIKESDKATRDMLSTRIDTCHVEHQRQLDQRDERQAQVWDKFTNALQQMRSGGS